MKSTVCFIVAITLLMTIHFSSAQVETNGCNSNCTLEPSKTPICATDDTGDTKIFPSDCIMRSENCKNKTKYVETGPATNGSCP